MVPRKKGQKYEISYRCPNYEKPFSERFDSYEAAKLRIAQIEYEKSLGTFEVDRSSNMSAEEVALADRAHILAGAGDDGNGRIAVGPHFLKALPEGAVVVQVGHIALGNQKIGNIHCDDSSPFCLYCTIFRKKWVNIL